jgi:hypothetical protein
MRNEAATWQFCALLPNLCLKDAIGNDLVALVPYDDERLQQLCCRDTVLASLLHGFTDQFQRPRRPSAIIAQEPLPAEVMVDFRNVVAVSCIIGAAQVSLVCDAPISSVWPVKFSDHFDLYPITPVLPPGKGLLTNSYAGVGIDDDVGKFRGQTSPTLFNVEQAVPAPDGTILSMLMRQCETVWHTGDVQDRQRSLFRSLQLAYHASTMPQKNMASLYDYGLSVVHWVSAMEILLHPEKGDVNERHVLNELFKHQWQAQDLRRTRDTLPSRRSKRECACLSLFKDRSPTIDHGAMQLNAVQHLYNQLYKTRNDFIHGNDLTNAPYHSPFGNMQGPGWLVVAPLVFKAALSCFFGRYDSSTHFEDALTAILSQSLAVQGNAPQASKTVAVSEG